jgi:hypothetical protein
MKLRVFLLAFGMIVCSIICASAQENLILEKKFENQKLDKINPTRNFDHSTDDSNQDQLDIDNYFRTSVFSRSITGNVGSAFVDLVSDSIWRGKLTLSGSLTTSTSDSLKSIYQLINNGGNFNIRWAVKLKRKDKNWDHNGFYFYPKISINLSPINSDTITRVTGNVDVGMEYHGAWLSKKEKFGVVISMRAAFASLFNDINNDNFAQMGFYAEPTVGLIIDRKYILVFNYPIQWIDKDLPDNALANLSARMIF